LGGGPPLEIHDTRSAGDVETKTETATATEIDSRKWPVDDRVATTTSPLPLQMPQFSVFSAQFAAFSFQLSAFGSQRQRPTAVLASQRRPHALDGLAFPLIFRRFSAALLMEATSAGRQTTTTISGYLLLLLLCGFYFSSIFLCKKIVFAPPR